MALLRGKLELLRVPGIAHRGDENHEIRKSDRIRILRVGSAL
jgi:hypothetical protein